MRPAIDHWKAQRPRFFADCCTTRRCRRAWAGAARSLRITGWNRRSMRKLIGHARAAIDNGTHGGVQAADSQCGSDRGRDALRRDRAQARVEGPGAGDDSLLVHRIGRTELRSVPGARRDAGTGRRRERLRRQGTLGRQADRLSAAQVDVPAGRKHSDRKRRACTARRRARRSSTGARASGSRCAIRARRRWSKAWAITAAST